VKNRNFKTLTALSGQKNNHRPKAGRLFLFARAFSRRRLRRRQSRAFFRSRQGLKEYTKTEEEEEGRKEKEWRPLRSVVSQQPPGNNNLMRGRFRRAGEEPRARVLVRGALEERR